MEILSHILKERPEFHEGETEVRGTFSIDQSLLSKRISSELLLNKSACYGIRADVAAFIFNNVYQESATLEIGAGISTLVFALRGSKHTTVTPNEKEIDRIKKYAKAKNISTASITFISEESEKFLPHMEIDDLDFVFIDGKHAFPWPIIDWFYTVERLKKNGILLVDDIHLISGSILVEFMQEDPRWQLLKQFKKRSVAFRKEADSIHDVAWHMQPYLMESYKRANKGIINRLRRIKGVIRHLLRSK